jgi:hypothetical protein
MNNYNELPLATISIHLLDVLYTRAGWNIIYHAILPFV